MLTVSGSPVGVQGGSRYPFISAPLQNCDSFGQSSTCGLPEPVTPGFYNALILGLPLHQKTERNIISEHVSYLGCISMLQKFLDEVAC